MSETGTPGSKPETVNIVLVSNDESLRHEVNAAVATKTSVNVQLLDGLSRSAESKLVSDDANLAIVDLDANSADDLETLTRVVMRSKNTLPVLIVTESLNERLTRQLLHLRIADVMVKPVKTTDLVRTCQRLISGENGQEQTEAKIVTFLPAGGGVGVTTLALQAAFLYHSEQRSLAGTTCVADLNFQHGACADFLDLEPRLDLNEVEPRPERLDRQLLEVMISKHDSGLSVIAAPNKPAEMRSFDPAMVTRLLDLVSAYFDTVVIDMPRTWFSWTDSVLLGSDKLYIVSEATVPGLRQAQRLIAAIEERFEGEVNPQVIVNRFDSRRFGNGLQTGDIESALSGRLAGTVCNNYQLVREAVDRGVPIGEIEPNNNITLDLKKILIPEAAPVSKSSRMSWLMPFRRAAAM